MHLVSKGGIPCHNSCVMFAKEGARFVFVLVVGVLPMRAITLFVGSLPVSYTGGLSKRRVLGVTVQALQAKLMMTKLSSTSTGGIGIEYLAELIEPKVLEIWIRGPITGGSASRRMPTPPKVALQVERNLPGLLWLP